MPDTSSHTDLSVTVGFRLAMVNAIAGLEDKEHYTKQELLSAVDATITDEAFLTNDTIKASGKDFFTKFIENQSEESLNNFIDSTKDAAKDIQQLRTEIGADPMLLDAIGGERTFDMLAKAEQLRGIQSQVEVFEAAAEQHLGIPRDSGMTGEIDKYFASNPTEFPPPTPEEQSANPFMEMIMGLFSAIFGIDLATTSPEQPQQLQHQSSVMDPAMQKSLEQAGEVNLGKSGNDADSINAPILPTEITQQAQHPYLR